MVHRTELRSEKALGERYVHVRHCSAFQRPGLKAPEQEMVRFSNNTHKMIVGCLLGGNSMKSGVHVLREACIPNFAELDEAFDAVGKALSCEQRVQT